MKATDYTSWSNKDHVINQISDAVFVVDLDGVILALNDELARRIGQPRSKILGTTPEMWLVSNDDNPDTKELISDCVRNGQVSFRPRYLSKDGTWRTSDVRLQTLTDGDGRIVGIISISRDITELIRLQEEQMQAHRLAVLGELSAGIAHDFNNSLQAIQGYLELAIDNNSTEQSREFLKQSLKVVEHSANITRGLLAYARKQPLNPVLLSAEEIIGESKKVLLSSLTSSYNLEFLIADDVHEFVADKNQLIAVIVNLVINAREASRPGDRIIVDVRNTIDADCRDPARFGRKMSGFVRFSVIDEGCGIEPREIEKIFDPFYTSRKGFGKTGLGLSMAYGFAMQSGGCIRAESEPGSGTTMHLYLPRSSEAARSEQKGDAASQESLPEGLNVFVLDDNESIVHTIALNLEQMRCNVIASTSMEHALKKASGAPRIDVFLVDMLLSGGRSGREFIERVKELGIDRPVVFMSGYSEASERLKAAVELDGEVLEKPFSARRLIAAIGNALEARN